MAIFIRAGVTFSLDRKMVFLVISLMKNFSLRTNISSATSMATVIYALEIKTSSTLKLVGNWILT